jgi:CBS domain-containing membrane protein
MPEDVHDPRLARAAGMPPRGERHWPWPPPGTGRRAAALCGGAGVLAALALLGWATGDPLVYPPLGATAFLVFSTPDAPSAAPRNAIGGQACGVAGGVAALAAFGLLHQHGAVTSHLSGARVGATSVALLLSTALMLLFKVSHPAAGATAVLIGLGIVIAPSEWLELVGAVVVICGLGMAVNRLVGIAYPLWSPPDPV